MWRCLLTEWGWPGDSVPHGRSAEVGLISLHAFLKQCLDSHRSRHFWRWQVHYVLSDLSLCDAGWGGSESSKSSPSGNLQSRPPIGGNISFSHTSGCFSLVKATIVGRVGSDDAV